MELFLVNFQIEQYKRDNKYSKYSSDLKLGYRLVKANSITEAEEKFKKYYEEVVSDLYYCKVIACWATKIIE